MFTIRAKQYNLIKKYFHWDTNKEYPHFETEDVVTFRIKAKSIKDAYIWLLENHPELAIGCHISNPHKATYFQDASLDYYFREMKTLDLQEIAKNNLIAAKAK